MKTKYGFIQFGKIALSLFTVIWYITAFFGMAFVWRKGEGFSDLLLFVGAPMSLGIITYYINSAVEKHGKEKYGGEEDANEII